MKIHISEIKNLFILLACFLVIAFRGKSTKKQKEIKNMVIIQMAKLGDMVCTTPMLRAVKEKYPQVNIIIVGDKVNKKLLEGHQDIEQYIVWDGKSPRIIRELRNLKPDFGCVTGPNFEGLAALIIARVPLISVPKVEGGWSPFETKSYRILRRFVVSKSHTMGTYAPREYLRLLEPLDIFTDATKKYLYYSNKAELSIKKFFEKNYISKNDLVVGISPSAGNKIKNWPAERFAQVAEYLYKRYKAKVIVFGGPNDKAEVEGMVKHLGGNIPFINVLGIFDIDELKCIISKLNLFIAVDTGPIYIAEAFGVPTVDIVGPMDEREQPPISEINRVVLPLNRIKPELHIMNARVYNVIEARRQVESISVEAVLVEIDKLRSELA